MDYRVADLFSLPEAWYGAFDLVMEIRTLQSMPPDRRAAAATAIAAAVAPGGTLFVHSFGAPEGARFDGPPWPVTDSQLTGLTEAGLARVDDHSTARTALGWSFTAIYRRHPPA